MPTYVYKYRRRYGRRYSRYRRYSGAYSRYRRRRSGTSSTASSRGRIRVRVPIQQVVTMTVPAGSIDSNLLTSSPFYWTSSITSAPYGRCGAVATPLYRAYTSLYDQVKCDGVVTNLSVVSPIGGGSGAAASALQVIVAYDRQGNFNEVLNGDGVTVAQLFNFSSAVVRSAINNSVAKMSRSCWASDLQERTMFHDCTVSASGNPVNTITDGDFSSNQQKVGYFAPLTYVGLRLAAAAPTSDLSIQVLLEQTYYFTFRNPKFGADTSNSASFSVRPVTMDSAVDTRTMQSTQVMDDDGGLDDEAAQAAQPAARVARATPLSSLFDSSIPVPARFRQ
ncbi:putative capsid protein [Hudisavirus sp.]|uniref:putative capsid protein n=1 Tax=Hudisavirus sp. TaxID=2021738 RepID=UPI000B9D7F99|nr:putative capsid protein [Hudisavirus sp.]ASU55896.1 putative capsid protein [Hudisavirus sp.]